MNFSIKKTFITADFLLATPVSQQLYHEHAADLPIIDYHNHLPAWRIAKNIPFDNLYEAWLAEDHYKWRAMRANGADEKYITGAASAKEKFKKWAETIPYTVANPLFHWTHLELLRYFGIDAILQPDTAEKIYRQANEILQNKSPRQLLKERKFEVVCTTDDPADDLSHHQKIADTKGYVQVFPTFRSDALFLIEQNSFKPYLHQLAAAVGFAIACFDDFKHAIDARIDFFHQHGCRMSDIGTGQPIHVEKCAQGEAALIFKKRLENRPLSLIEIHQYRTWLLLYLARKYHAKHWAQQYHLGALRNNNTRLRATAGEDAGCDSIADHVFAAQMAQFFGTLDQENQLAKTIVYNLNPSQNEVFATMMGNFNTSEFPGKMQWGPAWWYLDQKKGWHRKPFDRVIKRRAAQQVYRHVDRQPEFFVFSSA